MQSISQANERGIMNDLHHLLLTMIASIFALYSEDSILDNILQSHISAKRDCLACEHNSAVESYRNPPSKRRKCGKPEGISKEDGKGREQSHRFDAFHFGIPRLAFERDLWVLCGSSFADFALSSFPQRQSSWDSLNCRTVFYYCSTPSTCSNFLKTLSSPPTSRTDSYPPQTKEHKPAKKLAQSPLAPCYPGTTT